MPLSETAGTGDRLATLRDLRAVLALNVQECTSMRDLAALSGRLQSVLEEIARLEPKMGEGDGIDEISRRRAARRTSSAARASRAARPG